MSICSEHPVDSLSDVEGFNDRLQVDTKDLHQGQPDGESRSELVHSLAFLSIQRFRLYYHLKLIFYVVAYSLNIVFLFDFLIHLLLFTSLQNESELLSAGALRRVISLNEIRVDRSDGQSLCLLTHLRQTQSPDKTEVSLQLQILSRR